MIVRHGYPLETYEAVTPDGYILTVYRIPAKDSEAQPVFVQHGLLMDSGVWVALGDRSLGTNNYDIKFGVFYK